MGRPARGAELSARQGGGLPRPGRCERGPNLRFTLNPQNSPELEKCSIRHRSIGAADRCAAAVGWGRWSEQTAPLRPFSPGPGGEVEVGGTRPPGIPGLTQCSMQQRQGLAPRLVGVGVPAASPNPASVDGLFVLGNTRPWVHPSPAPHKPDLVTSACLPWGGGSRSIRNSRSYSATGGVAEARSVKDHLVPSSFG